MVSLTLTKFLGYLYRIIGTLLPRSNDALRCFFSILLRLYRKITRPARQATSFESYCASSAPVSTGLSHTTIQVTTPAEESNNLSISAAGVSSTSAAPSSQGPIAVVSPTQLPTATASPAGVRATPTAHLLPPPVPHPPHLKLNGPILPTTQSSTASLSISVDPYRSANGARVLRPGAPEEIMTARYLNRKIVANVHTEVILESGKMEYDEPDVLPGWVRHIHPEGAPYFFHTNNRIITDAGASRLQKVMDIADRLLSAAVQLNLPLHADVELVIGLVNQNDGRRECLYYFVDHQQEVLFWVHPYKLSNIFAHVKGVNSPSHTKLAITTQYWIHLELYPNERVVKAEHHEELKGMLIHASAESITSDTSVAPFDSDELGRMLDLMDKVEGSIDKENVYVVCVMARFMRLFSESKFINFYGQPGARLNADQSVYHGRRKLEWKPSMVIRVADLVMFGSPSAHARELERVWVDQTVNFPRWKGFIGKLSSEWAGFTIYSTVMLAVDVSFLAIPVLGPANNNSGPASGSQGDIPTSQEVGAIIATYSSILCIVGSLVVSVHLSGRVRGQENSSAKDAVTMMLRSTQSMLGTDALAIMYSLPYALLVWGMLFFILALAMVMFANKNAVVLGTIGPGAVIVGLLVSWPLWGQRGYHSTLFELGKAIVGSFKRKLTFKRSSTPFSVP